MPAVSNFEQTINDYAGKTFGEYTLAVENAKNEISDGNLRNAIDKYNKESEDSILSQWKNAIGSLEKIGIKGTGNLSYNAATNLDKMIKDLNLSKNKRDDILNRQLMIMLEKL